MADMEKHIGELSGPVEPAEEAKRKLDKLLSISDEVSPSIVRLRKAGEEKDPAKKTYGDSMAQKVLSLCDRFDALAPGMEQVKGKVTAGDETLPIPVSLAICPLHRPPCSPSPSSRTPKSPLHFPLLPWRMGSLHRT